MNARETMKKTILSELKKGSMPRIDLHRNCCKTLGFSTEPLINAKGQRIRICRDMTDYTFDPALNELKGKGYVEGKRKGQYVFYKIAEEQKKVLRHE